VGDVINAVGLGLCGPGYLAWMLTSRGNFLTQAFIGN